jgi:hypothetical protein
VENQTEKQVLDYSAATDRGGDRAGNPSDHPVLKKLGAGFVLLATLAIAGWLVWSQLIATDRPRAIYLPKEYRSAGALPPAPNFGAPGRGAGRMRNLGLAPGIAAGPPSAAEIDAFFGAVRTNNFASVQGMLTDNRQLAQSFAPDKTTPLHITTSAEIAQMLLDFGAKVDIPDGVHNDPPIRWHARDRDLKIATLLFAHDAKIPSDIFFVCAISVSDETQLKSMITADPSLLQARSRDNDILGRQATPLLVGASWDRIKVVSTLLDAGAKVDDVFAGASGASALHVAAWNNDPAMINLLLSHDAPIEAVSRLPQGTPLTWAVMRGGRNAVQTLLDHGAAITPDMIDMAAKGAKGTDPANLPGKPTDYSAITLILQDHLPATPATKP